MAGRIIPTRARPRPATRRPPSTQHRPLHRVDVVRLRDRHFRAPEQLPGAGRRRSGAYRSRRVPLPAGSQRDDRREAAGDRVFGIGRYYRPLDFPYPQEDPTLSRLRPFLLFAALAALATVFAACGSDDGGSGGGSDESPEAVLKGSTFEGVESADLDLSVKVDVSGDEGGTVDVSLAGPFQSTGMGQLPELDMTAEASGSVGGKDVDFDGGVVLVPNKAYVAYEGEDYEVDSTTFSFIQSAIEEAQRESGAEGGTKGATKCQEEAAAKFSAEDFVENLSNEGSADVGGTETTKVSGELDVSGALEA